LSSFQNYLILAAKVNRKNTSALAFVFPNKNHAVRQNNAIDFALSLEYISANFLE
jgi:hypothetical protein